MAEGEPGEDLLASVKGRLHTIKGNSAMMGLMPIRDVAHALEDACGFLGRAPASRGMMPPRCSSPAAACWWI